MAEKKSHADCVIFLAPGESQDWACLGMSRLCHSGSYNGSWGWIRWSYNDPQAESEDLLMIIRLDQRIPWWILNWITGFYEGSSTGSHDLMRDPQSQDHRILLWNLRYDHIITFGSYIHYAWLDLMHPWAFESKIFDPDKHMQAKGVFK